MAQPSPVDFKRSIDYVNKVKDRFADEPEVYKQFLYTLQVAQREALSFQAVRPQIADLFKCAPDLVEEFNLFIPKSSAEDPRHKSHELSNSGEAEKSLNKDSPVAEKESQDTARSAISKDSAYRHRL